jgi:hypothetical protein
VSLDDLSAAFLSRNINNPQLASILNSAPSVESPTGNLLYGERIFTSSVRASLSHSYSPRLTLTFRARGRRSQHVSDTGADAVRSAYLVFKTTAGGGNIDISYSLSPRTQVGATVDMERVASRIYDVFTTASTASLGRTLGRRWFVEVHGGVAIANSIQQTSFLRSTSSNPVAGGSLGFKTLDHTFLGSYDRRARDSYGAGAATSSSSSASWLWSRPGRLWWLESSLGWEQLQGGAFSTAASGWRATTGLSRRMGTHVVWSMQYAYLDYSGRSQTVYTRSQSAVRVAVMWSPDPRLQ